jgi:TolB-like protein
MSKKMKMNFMKKNFLLLLSYFFVLPVFTDEVTLKNNKVIEKVKVKISVDKITLVYLDNKAETYFKKEVKFIRLKPIIVNNPVTEKEKIENEKEKIRVAESLQNISGIEIPEKQKLKVAVLNFKSSASISKEESDIIVETITVELVKTKLFIIVDPILVKQAMNDKGGIGCGDNPSNCKIPASQIAKSMNIAKVITGTVNKIKNSYYINGNVIDTNSNNIDFAESSIAISFEKIQETSENFSKKVAGGLMSISKTSINLDGDSSGGFFSNLFKSNPESEKGIEDNSSIKSPSRFSYVWRSSILPGWGQFANDRKIKGIAIFGIFAIGAGIELYSYNKYKAAINDYSGAGDNFIQNALLANANASGVAFYLNYKNFSEERERIEFYENRLETVGAGLAILYLYNIFDAYYFSKDRNAIGSENKKDISTKFSAIPIRNSLGQSSTQYVLSFEMKF